MIHDANSDDVLAYEFGQRLKTRRLNLNLTAKSVATTIGVALGTYLRLEEGQGKLVSLIATLRALGELQALDSFLPPVPFSPIQMVKLAGSQRKRGTKRLQILNVKKKPKDEPLW